MVSTSTKTAILVTLIVFIILFIGFGVLYKLFRPRHLELDEIISNEPNLTTPLIEPWSNSWSASWANSCVSSWGWLRRDKHDQLLPTSHPPSKSSLVYPQPTTENIVSPIEVTPAERPLQYTILSVELERAVPNASPPLPSLKKELWDSQLLISPKHWRIANKSRKSRPPRSRSTSPYRPSSGCFHSQPIDVPSKKRRGERPTFPLPEKLIWKKLTPYERAGMVWYRNAAY
ncbi:hypothetical protein TMatcc_004363 [Talaromyces marneffei ATCC 18224]|uniref:Uncharacterized protein n=1 Tax=Talaromyces marneffei PM1 TaxID=1077442 RepID=A0A093VV84_TALMA|nr:uncharacterized protein EYB26_000684 [Talaromyces marneffei]KAE8556945.1 hypothetical protein EYB25_001651 [Talaromyces marneffei]QGA13039.1 hypothetical protein EYB26_000684 [Talaromyces marneffei]